MSTVQGEGPPAADGHGPTVPRMLVGIELHRYREAAGITPEQAAYIGVPAEGPYKPDHYRY